MNGKSAKPVFTEAEENAPNLGPFPSSACDSNIALRNISLPAHMRIEDDILKTRILMKKYSFF
jgi:hypothetical protein